MPEEYAIRQKGLDPETDFYLLPISFFEFQLWNEITSMSYVENTEVIEGFYKVFLDGCYKRYEHFTERKEDPYHYFANILFVYRSLRNKLFFEKEGKIHHKLINIELSRSGDKIQQIASMHYFYINEIISYLEGYTKRTASDIKQNSIKNITPKQKIRGFRVKNRDCLNSAYDRLRSHLILSLDVRYKDFEDAFTGWIPDNKITWLKGPGQLSYFIKSINGKGIEFNKTKWITTVHCFQNKPKNDSIPKDFTIKQLHFYTKRPNRTKEIDLVIKVINRYTGEED
jgi:hypothetical protein